MTVPPEQLSGVQVRTLLRETAIAARAARLAHNQAVKLAFASGLRSEQVAAEVNKALERSS